MSSTAVRPAEPLTVVRDEGPTATDLVRAVLLRHGLVLFSLAALFIGVAVVLVPISHLLIHHYAVHSTKPGFPTIGTAAEVRGSFEQLAQGLMVVSVILVAVFGGSVLLPPDFESGTIRYTWTQAAGRRRILLVTMVMFFIVIALCGSLAALIYSHGQMPLQRINYSSPWEIRIMLLTLPAYPILLLGAFSIGLVLGALLRRTIRAIAATLVALVVLAYGISTWLFQKSTNWFGHVLKTKDVHLFATTGTVRGLGFLNTLDRAGGTLINWGCTTPGGQTTLYDSPSRAAIAKDHLSCFITYQTPSGVSLHQWIWVGFLMIVVVSAVWGTFRLTAGRDTLWFERQSRGANRHMRRELKRGAWIGR